MRVDQQRGQVAGGQREVPGREAGGQTAGPAWVGAEWRGVREGGGERGRNSTNFLLSSVGVSYADCCSAATFTWKHPSHPPGLHDLLHHPPFHHSKSTRAHTIPLGFLTCLLAGSTPCVRWRAGRPGRWGRTGAGGRTGSRRGSGEAAQAGGRGCGWRYGKRRESGQIRGQLRRGCGTGRYSGIAVGESQGSRRAQAQSIGPRPRSGQAAARARATLLSNGSWATWCTAFGEPCICGMLMGLDAAAQAPAPLLPLRQTHPTDLRAGCAAHPLPVPRPAPPQRRRRPRTQRHDGGGGGRRRANHRNRQPPALGAAALAARLAAAFLVQRDGGGGAEVGQACGCGQARNCSVSAVLACAVLCTCTGTHKLWVSAVFSAMATSRRPAGVTLRWGQLVLCMREQCGRTQRVLLSLCSTVSPSRGHALGVMLVTTPAAPEPGDPPVLRSLKAPCCLPGPVPRAVPVPVPLLGRAPRGGVSGPTSARLTPGRLGSHSSASTWPSGSTWKGGVGVGGTRGVH